MYVKKLAIYDFRCFGKATLDLQYPGRTGSGTSEVANVNLILGDNGGGKSSVLRAVAIAVLAPVLLESGFVAYRTVRRPARPEALLKVLGILDRIEDERETPRRRGSDRIELLARFEARGSGNRDRLHLEKTPSTPIAQRIYDDFSPAFFMVGYGATRRVETGEYSESSARRSRGLRYQRVAGLFEDHVAVRPLQMWFKKLRPEHREDALAILNRVLPKGINFYGDYDSAEDQFVFDFNGQSTPFSSLSDGYKAFVGMAGDLLGHLSDVCPSKLRLGQIPGIVLIDEIDLHLHPEWQRTILPSLATAFPKLQFICTSHSPMVASTVRKENVFVTATAADGTATIKQIEEHVYGLSSEQMLLSSYFGLQSTRPEEFRDEAEELFRSAATGDREAALKYLDKLSGPVNALKRNAAKKTASRRVAKKARRPVARAAPKRRK